MDWSLRTYLIINTSDITNEMNRACKPGRLSIDGTKTLLKWDGDTPSCFDGLTTYTHSEILTELAKSEWTGE
tara:strand:+ start:963 stop:1178 length:216 start_codon:yes stop_codon:yes gene_type:complete